MLLLDLEGNKRDCAEVTLCFPSLRSIVRLFIEQLIEAIVSACEP